MTNVGHVFLSTFCCHCFFSLVTEGKWKSVELFEAIAKKYE